MQHVYEDCHEIDIDPEELEDLLWRTESVEQPPTSSREARWYRIAHESAITNLPDGLDIDSFTGYLDEHFHAWIVYEHGRACGLLAEFRHWAWFVTDRPVFPDFIVEAAVA